ncbi:MAG: DNA double-strand break repair nuclease NurA [Euryarchaeota archaeon]|nr:DNA double-strand break repair nuclease NurA [Euryarchaeota archaeon]
MLEKVYEELALKRQELRRRFAEWAERGQIERYASNWNSFVPEPLQEPCAGVDGSFNHCQYRSAVLYAVNACACAHLGGELREYPRAEVDLLPPAFAREILELRMARMELQCALDVHEDVELVMLDGSLHSALSAPRTWWRFIPAARAERLVELAEQGSGEAESDEERLLLEYIAYLQTLQRLLEHAGVEKLVFISKSSTDSTLLKGIPDQAVYEALSPAPGYSRPREKLLHHRFPVHEQLFRSLVFTTFYARLEPGRSVLRVELPREAGEAELRRLLGVLYSVCVEGYPYPLRKAHSRVVVTGRHMSMIAAAVGVTEKTGREVLG